MIKTRLLESASSSVFVPPSGRYPGYLLFARAGSLVAQPFDADRLSISGDAQVISPVGIRPSILGANFSASANGVIVLGLRGQLQAQFAWFDRGGKQLGGAFPSEYHTPRISPDGKFVAFRRLESIGRSSFWLLDLSREAFSPIADDSGALAWSSDSTEVIYRRNDFTFFRKKINSSGVGVPIFSGTSTVSHMDWSPDGKYLVANRGQFYSVDGKHPVPAPLEPSGGFRFSPDGNWLAFQVQGKEGYEVIVQSFPDAAIRLQVSTAGGSYPSWRGDGKEIFFRATDGRLTALTVTPRNNTLLFGPPEPLFQIKGELSTAPFTAAPDGQKFLVRVPLSDGSDAEEMTVLTNWRAGLKQ